MTRLTRFLHSPHPIHAHGLNMYILADGDGTYNGTASNDTTFVRTSNPMRRDVQNVRPFGHIIVQVDSTNAGVWPFHCHIAWHASAGFFSQFVFQPDKIADLKFPSSMADTCASWDAWTKTEKPNQIDSGL